MAALSQRRQQPGWRRNRYRRAQRGPAGPVLIAAATLLVACAAAAQGPIAYPAAGQDAAQQTRDHGECRARATRATGVDSADLASSSAGGSASASGERRADATPGGAARDDLARLDAERAAQLGAAAAAEKRRATAPNPAEAPGTYYRAYAACMERRGYTLK